MPQDWVRWTLSAIWLFVFTLWIITSRGSNIANFFRSLTNVRSTSIVLFEIAGLILTIGGAGLASWAKVVMGTNWGRPAQHDKDVQSSLVTTGPFAYSRNPLYLGLLIMVIGQEIALHSYLIVLAPLFFIAITMAAAAEEKLLAHHFGKSYLTYQSRVPRFL